MIVVERIPARNVIIALCAILLVSCSDVSSKHGLERYAERLSNVLTVSLTLSLSETEVIAYPKLVYESNTTSNDLSVLEFLKLHGCEVQLVIAQKNNSLGKFAPSSQQLINSLSFLETAPDCIDDFDLNSETREKLVQAMKTKKAGLGYSIWRATLGSPEFQSLWDTRNTVDDYPDAFSSEPPLSLRSLNESAESWLSGDYAAESNKLEYHLSVVRSGDAGLLFSHLEEQSRLLDQISTQILMHVEQGNFCRGQLRLINVQRVKNVVQKFFVGEFQAYASRLSQRFYELIEPIKYLEARLAPYEGPSFNHWRMARDESMAFWLNAAKRHVTALEKLYAQCAAK